MISRPSAGSRREPKAVAVAGGTAHQALKTLGLLRGRSKFSFLIRRWGNQTSRRYSYIISS